MYQQYYEDQIKRNKINIQKKIHRSIQSILDKRYAVPESETPDDYMKYYNLKKSSENSELNGGLKFIIKMPSGSSKDEHLNKQSIPWRSVLLYTPKSYINPLMFKKNKTCQVLSSFKVVRALNLRNVSKKQILLFSKLFPQRSDSKYVQKHPCLETYGIPMPWECESETISKLNSERVDNLKDKLSWDAYLTNCNTDRISLTVSDDEKFKGSYIVVQSGAEYSSQQLYKIVCWLKKNNDKLTIGEFMEKYPYWRIHRMNSKRVVKRLAYRAAKFLKCPIKSSSDNQAYIKNDLTCYPPKLGDFSSYQEINSFTKLDDINISRYKMYMNKMSMRDGTLDKKDISNCFDKKKSGVYAYYNKCSLNPFYTPNLENRNKMDMDHMFSDGNKFHGVMFINNGRDFKMVYRSCDEKNNSGSTEVNQHPPILAFPCYSHGKNDKDVKSTNHSDFEIFNQEKIHRNEKEMNDYFTWKNKDNKPHPVFNNHKKMVYKDDDLERLLSSMGYDNFGKNNKSYRIVNMKTIYNKHSS